MSKPTTNTNNLILKYANTVVSGLPENTICYWSCRFLLAKNQNKSLQIENWIVNELVFADKTVTDSMLEEALKNEDVIWTINAMRSYIANDIEGDAHETFAAELKAKEAS